MNKTKGGLERLYENVNIHVYFFDHFPESSSGF